MHQNNKCTDAQLNVKKYMYYFYLALKYFVVIYNIHTNVWLFITVISNQLTLKLSITYFNLKLEYSQVGALWMRSFSLL